MNDVTNATLHKPRPIVNPSSAYDHLTPAQMVELDKNGWAPIHHAVHDGILAPLEKFVTTNKQLLELRTGDTNSTPLLVAVSTGNLEAVQALLQLGARPDVVDAKNHGIVDVCASKQYMNILEYLAELNHSKLSVWKSLVKLLRSDFDEEVEGASWSLQALTLGCNDEQPTEVSPVTAELQLEDNKSPTTSSSDLGAPKILPKWRWAYDSGIVPAIVEVLKSTKSELIKLDTLRTLDHIMNHLEVKEQAQSFGIVVTLPPLVLADNKEVILLAARVLKHMTGVRYFAEDACKHSLYFALIETIRKHNDPTVLAEVIDACGIIAEGSAVMQTNFGETPDSVSTLVRLYEQQASRRVLVSLSSSIARLANRHVDNQRLFVTQGALTFLMALTKVKHMNVQLSAVEAIRALLENNKFTQTYVIESDQAKMLLNALGRNSHHAVRDTAARALWIVASFDVEERRKIAELMGMKLFIEFLGTESLNFNLIGAEGLEVLSRSPRIKLSPEEQVNGVQALVGLLNTGKNGAPANVLAAMRALCVAIGYVPRTPNQTALVKINGIVSLMSLIAQSEDTLIQVEAMHTLACVSLGY